MLLGWKKVCLNASSHPQKDALFEAGAIQIVYPNCFKVLLR
ncbi:hypothetical protein NIES4101_47530 [Calothrix sp. NIES-4101]|nr:hypothetical protein NIES4101_47530 [Calothrix sp. NIES-4101]